MRSLINKFQNTMISATFAEAGEWDTAKEMAPEPHMSREPSWLNKVFMAITFAESGLRDEALHFLEPVPTRNRGFNSATLNDLGLKGIQLAYGTVSI